MMRRGCGFAFAVTLLVWNGGAGAADLIGVVTDRAGRPQAGAVVELLDKSGQPMQPPQRVLSNAQGQYLIPNIEANFYMLRCGNTQQTEVLKVSIGVVRFDCRL
jgi:hypothetical protein